MRKRSDTEDNPPMTPFLRSSNGLLLSAHERVERESAVRAGTLGNFKRLRPLLAEALGLNCL